MKTRVYILGAGCSARYGYPVAKNLVSDLELYAKSLGSNAKQLKKCIESTVATMRKHNVQTVDDLAFRFRNGSLEDEAARDHNYREQRIRDAKRATAALFLSKESAARRTGLASYRDLLLEACSGAGGLEAKLSSSNCRVLTFNYDRLFEMAALDFLGPHLAQKGIYEVLLNSGFGPFGDQISFSKDGFCFLKLHGSVGAQARFEYGETRYHPFDARCKLGDEIIATDEIFFPPQDEDASVQTESLIVFPHEKHHVHSGGKHLYYGKYLTAIWSKAKEIISEADEIFVVGYSFSTMDRNSTIELLSGAVNCRRVVIQNLKGEAEAICKMLSVKHADLKLNWIPFDNEF